jgi:GNAT superfamily N-acetyltransferase
VATRPTPEDDPRPAGVTAAIREAAPSDAGRIAELHVEGWQEFRPFVPEHLLAARSVAARTQAWSEFLSGERTRSWTAVYETDGEVVGFVSSILLDEPDEAARAEIRQLFVTATMRGRGVGRRLLAASARWLAERGGEPIVLYSFTENPFRGAYERLGGEPIGQRPRSWDGTIVPESGYRWRSAEVLIRACEPP